LITFDGGEKVTDYFENDEIFRNFDKFYKRVMENMFGQIQGFDNIGNKGPLKGGWNIRPIKSPGVRGFVAQGRWQLTNEPFSTKQQIPHKEREPLTDVFDEKDSLKIYIELPGVDKKDIQLNSTKSHIEIKAKNFFKTLKLPTKNVDFEKVKASYKNGVLMVTIPKVVSEVKDGKKNTIEIE
jgi:HSP20 family molecular chaperone IbpA